MYKMTEGQILDKNKARDVLGNDFYSGLFDIKDDIRTLFGYFDRCFLVNQVLAKYNFFFKFFERRDKFKF